MRHDLAFCQLLRSKGFVTHDGYPASGGGGHGARTRSSLYGMVVKKRSRLVSFAVKGRSKVRPIVVIPGQAVHGPPEEAIRKRARNEWEVAVGSSARTSTLPRAGYSPWSFLRGSRPEPRRRIGTGYPVAPVLSLRSGHATRRPLPSGSRSRYPPRFRAACAVPKFQYRPQRPSQLPGSVFPAAS